MENISYIVLLIFCFYKFYMLFYFHFRFYNHVSWPEGKRPLGRPRRRWEDNIKMDLQEVGRGRGYRMELVQDRDSWRALVGTLRDFRVP